MRCTKCKKEIKDDSIFCEYCGNRIKPTTVQSSKFWKWSTIVSCTLLPLVLLSFLLGDNSPRDIDRIQLLNNQNKELQDKVLLLKNQNKELQDEVNSLNCTITFVNSRIETQQNIIQSQKSETLKLRNRINQLRKDSIMQQKTLDDLVKFTSR